MKWQIPNIGLFGNRYLRCIQSVSATVRAICKQSALWWRPEKGTAGDLGPEGILFINEVDSPMMVESCAI